MTLEIFTVVLTARTSCTKSSTLAGGSICMTDSEMFARPATPAFPLETPPFVHVIASNSCDASPSPTRRSLTSEITSPFPVQGAFTAGKIRRA